MKKIGKNLTQAQKILATIIFILSATIQLEIRGYVPARCDGNTCNDKNIMVYTAGNRKVFEAN